MLHPPAAIMDLRERQPCSVALCNLLTFIRFNDQHGHNQGDLLLRQVAQLWLAAVPAGGQVVRSKSDIIAVLPDTDAGAADALASALLQRSPFPWVSGAASWTIDLSFVEAVREADEHAYERRRLMARD